MSTAISHQHHHYLGRHIAMAAAAAAVVAGGATGIGYTLSQDDATAPTAPSPPSLGSTDCGLSGCAPQGRIGGGDFNWPNEGGYRVVPKGGRVMVGLL